MCLSMILCDMYTYNFILTTQRHILKKEKKLDATIDYNFQNRYEGHVMVTDQ